MVKDSELAEIENIRHINSVRKRWQEMKMMPKIEITCFGENKKITDISCLVSYEMP